MAVSLTHPPAGPPAPKRIALFTGNYNHIADGVSLTLNRLVNYLERQGDDVLVFGPTVENPPVQHTGRFLPVPSVRAPGRPEYRVSLRLPRAARAELEAFQPTLVHVATPDFLGRTALRWAQKRDLPLVASYHTHFSSYLKYYGFEEFEGFLWKYLRRFYRQCQHVYVPTRAMASVLQAHEITRGLRLWERGVDTDLFTPDRRSLTWRQHIGVQNDEVLISFVGRLVWEKGLDVFASVVEKLAQHGIRHKSLIVGEGPAREELEQRLPHTIFTGYLGGEALARAYASSDIFLFPSDTETFGNVTLEAMASGVTCVCADAIGSSSLVQHKVTGFLAVPREKHDFLKYTALLANKPHQRRLMAQQARERALRYRWDEVLRRMRSYYDEVLNPTPEEASLSEVTPLLDSIADTPPAPKPQLIGV